MTAETSARTVRWRILASVVVLGLVAAACGGGDGSGTAGGADANASEAGDPDEGETPAYGGSVLFAREAETNAPWTPATMTCDLSCHQAAKAVYDTLTYLGEDDEPHPFLLESVEPNEDFTVWTLTAREGITFHDGTPFDADTLLDHFDRMTAAPLVGRALVSIEGHTKVDDRTIELTMTEPWAAFPVYLSGLPGYVASPAWLAAVDAGQADATEPVGTGPFVFAEYNPSDNFRLTRNEDYWLSDADGNPYPYLDEIEFVVRDDDLTRSRAMISGEVDLTHTDKGESVLDLRQEAEAGSLELYEITDQAETTYVMMNVSDPASPAGDIRIREAMALATDQEFRNQSRSQGVFEIANGPFPPGRAGHLDDSGWPGFDPDRARELVDEYKADAGVDTVAVSFNVSADPDNRLTVELLQQLWAEVGIEVEIVQLEQSEAIRAVALGQFEVMLWRNHGGTNPDSERAFWHSEAVLPAGQIATNFGRFTDEVIDGGLDDLRASPDPAVIDEAAKTINGRFAEQFYNVWNDWVYWSIAHGSRVHGVRTPVALPDGTPSATRGIGRVGAIGVAQLWVDDAG